MTPCFPVKYIWRHSQTSRCKHDFGKRTYGIIEHPPAIQSTLNLASFHISYGLTWLQKSHTKIFFKTQTFVVKTECPTQPFNKSIFDTLVYSLPWFAMWNVGWLLQIWRWMFDPWHCLKMLRKWTRLPRCVMVMLRFKSGRGSSLPLLEWCVSLSSYQCVSTRCQTRSTILYWIHIILLLPLLDTYSSLAWRTCHHSYDACPPAIQVLFNFRDSLSRFFILFYVLSNFITSRPKFESICFFLWPGLIHAPN